MNNNTSARDAWTDRALIGLLLCSVAMNWALVVKLRNADRPGPERSAVIEAGTAVPAIEARSRTGAAARIQTVGRSKPLALYVFSPECGWCTRNSANFKALAGQASDRFEVVALSLTSPNLDEYIREHGIATDVYKGPSAATTEAYQLGATPGMIVVSREGKVLKHWRGAWAGSVQREVEEYFAVKLPGVAKVTAARR